MKMLQRSNTNQYKLGTLDLGSSEHLSWADGALHADRTLADSMLLVAKMLVVGA